MHCNSADKLTAKWHCCVNNTKAICTCWCSVSSTASNKTHGYREIYWLFLWQCLFVFRLFRRLKFYTAVYADHFMHRKKDIRCQVCRVKIDEMEFLVVLVVWVIRSMACVLVCGWVIHSPFFSYYFFLLPLGGFRYLFLGKVR
jgi:hypothetical protein